MGSSPHQNDIGRPPFSRRRTMIFEINTQRYSQTGSKLHSPHSDVCGADEFMKALSSHSHILDISSTISRWSGNATDRLEHGPS